MKKIKINLKLLFVFVLLLIFTQCSTEDMEIGNPEAPLINDHIRQLPLWVDQTIPASWDSVLEPLNLENEDDKIPFICDNHSIGISVATEDIISVGSNFGKIWPGALIEGNSLESGDLKLINIDRAPITINTNLPINKTFREIDNPNSVTVQQGISEMQIESGLMPDGARAGAGIMNTRVEEYTTFIQAMLSVGISAGFTEPQSKIKLSGEAGVSLEREQNTHSVIVKFVQNTFTVRLADDLIETPADFFANTVTAEDLTKLENSGTMSSSNVPLYIESVTYGRFLLFTMTSTTVKTAAKLNAAVEASWDKYAHAGGELSAEFELALSSKQTKIFSAGGSEEGANAAVAELDWSKFFVEAPVTTAVPISFVARTLNGRKKVVLIDNTAFKQRGNCESPEQIQIEVQISNVTLENPKLGVVQYEGVAFRNSQQVGDLLEVGEFVTNPWTTDKIVLGGKGLKAYSWEIANSDQEIDRFIVRSANILVHDNQVFNYPFKNLTEGRQKKTFYSTNNRGERMRFSYHITKTFIYP